MLELNLQELDCDLTPSNRSELRKYNRLKRDQSVRDKFAHMYEQERIRLDDCVAKLAKEFFLSKETVNRIITQK
jgi:hypothetical protein